MEPLKLRKQKRLLLISIIAWVGFFSLMSTGYTVENSFSYTLEYTDNRLSLAATNVPLHIILTDIQERTDLKVQIDKDHIGGTVSANFKQLDLAQAIGKILRGINYICFFGSGGNLEKIITIPGSPGQTALAREKNSIELPAGMDQNAPPAAGIGDMDIGMDVGSPFETENLGDPAEMKLAPVKEDIAHAMQIIQPPADLRIEQIMEIEQPQE